MFDSFFPIDAICLIEQNLRMTFDAAGCADGDGQCCSVAFI